jgi:hypothetical protein
VRPAPGRRLTQQQGEGVLLHLVVVDHLGQGAAAAGGLAEGPHPLHRPGDGQPVVHLVWMVASAWRRR